MSAKLSKADVIDLSQGQGLVRVLVHAWIDMCKRGLLMTLKITGFVVREAIAFAIEGMSRLPSAYRPVGKIANLKNPDRSPRNQNGHQAKQ